MKEIPQSIIDEVQEKCPTFCDLVIEVAKGKYDAVMMSIETFEDDPELFYKVMWYAHYFKISVVFAPRSNPKGRMSVN